MENGGFTIKRPGSGDMALQITSMADIFTIILVFLLKSFATGSLNTTVKLIGLAFVGSD